MNRSWLTGKISEIEMEKEHFLEWVEIQQQEEILAEKADEGKVEEQKG